MDKAREQGVDSAVVITETGVAMKIPGQPSLDILFVIDDSWDAVEESYQRRQAERMSRQLQQFIDKAIEQGFFDPEVITFTTEVK